MNDISFTSVSGTTEAVANSVFFAGSMPDLNIILLIKQILESHKCSEVAHAEYNVNDQSTKCCILSTDKLTLPTQHYAVCVL